MIIIWQLNLIVAIITVQCIHIGNGDISYDISCTTIICPAFNGNTECSIAVALPLGCCAAWFLGFCFWIDSVFCVKIDNRGVVSPFFQDGIGRYARIEYPLGHERTVVVGLAAIRLIGYPVCAEIPVAVQQAAVVLKACEVFLFSRPRTVVVVDVSKVFIEVGGFSEVVVGVDTFASGLVVPDHGASINGVLGGAAGYFAIKHAVDHHGHVVDVGLGDGGTAYVADNTCHGAAAGNGGIAVTIDDTGITI